MRHGPVGIVHCRLLWQGELKSGRLPLPGTHQRCEPRHEVSDSRPSPLQPTGDKALDHMSLAYKEHDDHRE